MVIYVALKNAGNLTKKVKAVPFYLDKTPDTLKELIESSVRSCLKAFIERAAGGDIPLSDEQIEGMREVGKFAFGVHYNNNEISVNEAIKIALDAFKDGLVRIFKGNEELSELDAKIKIDESDVITFVRLTMLSGRMW